MSLMDAIRAEIEAWAEKMEVEPSREVMEHFYADSLDGGTPEELADLSVGSVLCLLGHPVTREQMLEFMAVWCSAVLLAVRASRRADVEEPSDG